MCEMAAAWQITVDKNLGIFCNDPPVPDPLAKAENQVLAPNPPDPRPHNIWTQVVEVEV